ncbi:UNVERIFIED_CONTAM: hypothetical protein GTU68_038835 [Idotea baltica]|nr:hypothetical protein [Idotea baltica]
MPLGISISRKTMAR